MKSKQKWNIINFKFIILHTVFGLFVSHISTNSLAADLSSYVDDQAVIKLPIVGGDLSGITYSWDSKTFFVVQNNAAIITEFDIHFDRALRSFKLKGHVSDDYEGIAYLGSGRFALANESNDIILISILESTPDGSILSTDSSKKHVQKFTLPKFRKRGKGLEGVCYSSEGPLGKLYAVQEDKPITVFSWFLPNHSKDMSARDEGMWWWEKKADLPLEKTFDASRKLKHIASDLSDCYFNNSSRTLYLLSHESSALIEVDSYGNVLSKLKLTGAPQFEGVTMDDQENLYLVSEPYYLKIYKKP